MAAFYGICNLNGIFLFFNYFNQYLNRLHHSLIEEHLRIAPVLVRTQY